MQRKYELFDFIHIGHGKCMSTALQNIFSVSENYNYYHMDKMITTLDRIILNNLDSEQKLVAECNEFIATAEQTILSECMHLDTHINVLSNEGITFSFLAEPKAADYTLFKQKLLAILLGKFTKKVLFIVRDPAELINSFFYQSINEGAAFKSVNHYLSENRKTIINNFNILSTISFWLENDVAVNLIPLELLKKENDLFWSEFDYLGFPRPDKINLELDETSANRSRSEFKSLHSHLNSLINRIEEHLKTANYPEKDSLKTSTILMKVHIRRLISSAKPEELTLLSSLFSKIENLEKLKIDNELFEIISKNYLEPLSHFDFEFKTEIIENYRNNLSSIVV